MESDRFKLKIWDCRFNEYIDYDMIKICDDYILIGEWRKETVFITKYKLIDHELKVEQCTGKKDKNGKLIYEGDKVKTVTGAIGTVKWNEHFCKFEVEFPKDSKFLFACAVDETQEIIGNIHEEEN